MPPSDPAEPAGELSRTDRFMARLIEFIASLSPAERAAFVRRQRAVWIRHYERWAFEIDNGREAPGDITAEDYLATISALDRLLHRIEP